ncbi:MAG TPA: HYR domain-containing protein, partial [Pirellulaceae bacterium]|nr:HYR domain-containing protein [Pirellulaceae bacterium]
LRGRIASSDRSRYVRRSAREPHAVSPISRRLKSRQPANREINGLLGAGGRFYQVFSFERPANAVPTLEPLVPQTLECVAGAHTVKLTTVVDDSDDQPLTVTWSVDGQERKVESAVVPGSSVAFEFEYEHGEHEVEVMASDGIDQATSGATITVQDTVAPVLIAAPDVRVPTDPGKAFASGVKLPPPTATDASGHSVTLRHNAPATLRLGETLVRWTGTDEAGNVANATQKVLVVDQEPPAILPRDDVRTFCDRGKTLATVRLTNPDTTDNVPGGVVVTSSAKPRFKIGATNVLWTATDAAGNQSTWTQKVTVINRKPRANAGPNVTITTESEKGAKVSLDGSASFDRDGHKLKFAWSAPRVRLIPARSAKSSGRFPIGTTVARLTVTDAGGASHSDAVRVIVKLTNGEARPRGAEANASFASAARQASRSVAPGTSSRAALSGFAYAAVADRLGDAAGECIRWEPQQSPDDARLSYAELRSLQGAYGAAAAHALLAAYAETGEENFAVAYRYAAYGAACAGADLAHP